MEIAYAYDVQCRGISCESFKTCKGAENMEIEYAYSNWMSVYREAVYRDAAVLNLNTQNDLNHILSSGELL